MFVFHNLKISIKAQGFPTSIGAKNTKKMNISKNGDYF